MVVARHLSLRLDALGHGRVRVEGAWWVQEGQTVLVELSLHTGGQSSGVELNVPLFHIIRLTDGRAVEVLEYLDRHQALEAVRLREQIVDRRRSSLAPTRNLAGHAYGED